MFKEIWNKNKAGIAGIHFYSDKGINIASVTGFKYGSYLITDQVAYTIEKATEVEIIFGSKTSTNKPTFRYPFKEFKQNIIKSIKDNASFVLIKLNELNNTNIPSLKIAKERNYQVGTPVAVIGYQSDNQVIAMKSGIISAFNKSINLRFIQFEVPMNQGNSGSPLINAETGEVIGIAGYRLAMINKQHNKLMKIIKQNLEQISKLEGKYKHDNIDVSQILTVAQHQIKHLAHEFNRQTSFQYGFALELCELNDLFPQE